MDGETGKIGQIVAKDPDDIQVDQDGLGGLLVALHDILVVQWALLDEALHRKERRGFTMEEVSRIVRLLEESGKIREGFDLRLLIPSGDYCYQSLGRDPKTGRIRRIACPFWSLREDKPEQDNGYCAFLGAGDWETEGISLLWDMVKGCGENIP